MRIAVAEWKSRMRHMNHSGSSCLAVAAVLACSGLAAAQSIAPGEMQVRTVPYVPPSPVRLRTEVNVVEVPVVVRDGRRRAVAGLTRDDFEIYDSGKRRTVTAFSVENFTPPADAGGAAPKPAVIPAAPAGAAGPIPQARRRLAVLCFDDRNTDMLTLKTAKEAAQRFVKTSLAPGDLVAVVTTAQPLDATFTADVPALLQQIAKVTGHGRLTDDLTHDCFRISPYEAYLIANSLDRDVLYAKIAACSLCRRVPCEPKEVLAIARDIWARALLDSRNTLRVVEGLVDGMAKLPGQRTILLASAGFLTGTLEMDLEDLMAKARHAEVVINTLDAKGLYTVIPGGDASVRLQSPEETNIAEKAADAPNDGMEELASGTGGMFYHDNNDLARGFRDLGMVPEIMYVLSFAPADVAANGRYHRLKVRLTGGKPYSVQARLGYTAPSANATAPVAALSGLDREAMASDTVTDLPVGFTWKPNAGPSGVTVVAHVDVGRLHFETAQDRRRQKLTIVGVLMDSRGNFVTGKRSEFELNLTDATFEQLAKTAFTASMTLEAPPGTYTARAAIQDGLDGKVTAASSTVQFK